MLFCSMPFFYFFCAVFLLYWATPWQEVRIWILLIASFCFYARWNEWLALVVFTSTVMDYFFARGMAAPQAQRWRRLLLVLSLVMNLGLLVYFKYANFFLASLQQALEVAGSTRVFEPLKVILPVGISFYTFEAINYTVDVYRRKIPAERNLPHFMLFITFFPHLVAGPIVRAKDFLPQIRRPKHWDWNRQQLGAQLFLMGLFKKLAVADRMPMWVDPIFYDPLRFSSFAVWLGVIAYAVQIYCDFSGYTDMALGTAHMLGYKLAVNFNMPYLSVNISEFWRRWHISLSSWLRDYLFIPLGGSRGSRWLIYRNLLLTMTLGGLWHGASWTFVVWGMLHGLLLIGHRIFQDVCKHLPRLSWALQTAPGTLLRIGLTFSCVTFAWIFFRTVTFDCAWKILSKMSKRTPGTPANAHYSGLLATLVVLAICHLVGRYRLWERFAVRLPAEVLGVGYALVFCLVCLLNLDSGSAFIYFQF